MSKSAKVVLERYQRAPAETEQPAVTAALIPILRAIPLRPRPSRRAKRRALMLEPDDRIVGGELAQPVEERLARLLPCWHLFGRGRPGLRGLRGPGFP